jgi:hypothetical protein
VDLAPNPAAERRIGHAERVEHRLGEVMAEVDARRPLECLRENLEAVVGIHPALARLGHHIRRVHRVARGVREQVPHRCARRTGRRVEFDHALFYGDLCRAGHQRLGHRRQRELPLCVAVFRQNAGRPDHRGGDGRDRPIGDCVQRAHPAGA